MRDFVSYLMKTLTNTQKNNIHFRWPLWCTNSKQTHGCPTIEPWILPNDGKMSKQFLPYRQLKTTNKAFNAMDSTLNKDINTEHKEKKMIPSTKVWCTTTNSRERNCTNLKKGRVDLWHCLHIIVGPPLLTTSPCLRASPDWSGSLGFQGIFLSIYYVLKKRCVYVGWVFSRMMFGFCNLISLGFIQHLTLCLWRRWRGYHIGAMVVVGRSQTTHQWAFLTIKGGALL